MLDTIEALARDAITFIDALGLTTTDLVGHSMGGLAAHMRGRACLFRRGNELRKSLTSGILVCWRGCAGAGDHVA